MMHSSLSLPLVMVIVKMAAAQISLWSPSSESSHATARDPFRLPNTVQAHRQSSRHGTHHDPSKGGGGVGISLFGPGSLGDLSLKHTASQHKAGGISPHDRPTLPVIRFGHPNSVMAVPVPNKVSPVIDPERKITNSKSNTRIGNMLKMYETSQQRNRLALLPSAANEIESGQQPARTGLVNLRALILASQQSQLGSKINQHGSVKSGSSNSILQKDTSSSRGSPPTLQSELSARIKAIVSQHSTSGTPQGEIEPAEGNVVSTSVQPSSSAATLQERLRRLLNVYKSKQAPSQAKKTVINEPPRVQPSQLMKAIQFLRLRKLLRQMQNTPSSANPVPEVEATQALSIKNPFLTENKKSQTQEASGGNSEIPQYNPTQHTAQGRVEVYESVQQSHKASSSQGANTASGIKVGSRPTQTGLENLRELLLASQQSSSLQQLVPTINVPGGAKRGSTNPFLQDSTSSPSGRAPKIENPGPIEPAVEIEPAEGNVVSTQQSQTTSKVVRPVVERKSPPKQTSNSVKPSNHASSLQERLRRILNAHKTNPVTSQTSTAALNKPSPVQTAPMLKTIQFLRLRKLLRQRQNPQSSANAFPEGESTQSNFPTRLRNPFIDKQKKSQEAKSVSTSAIEQRKAATLKKIKELIRLREATVPVNAKNPESHKNIQSQQTPVSQKRVLPSISSSRNRPEMLDQSTQLRDMRSRLFNMIQRHRNEQTPNSSFTGLLSGGQMSLTHGNKGFQRDTATVQRSSNHGISMLNRQKQKSISKKTSTQSNWREPMSKISTYSNINPHVADTSVSSISQPSSMDVSARFLLQQVLMYLQQHETLHSNGFHHVGPDGRHHVPVEFALAGRGVTKPAPNNFGTTNSIQNLQRLEGLLSGNAMSLAQTGGNPSLVGVGVTGTLTPSTAGMASSLGPMSGIGNLHLGSALAQSVSSQGIGKTGQTQPGNRTVSTAAKSPNPLQQTILLERLNSLSDLMSDALTEFPITHPKRKALNKLLTTSKKRINELPPGMVETLQEAGFPGIVGLTGTSAPVASYFKPNTFTSTIEKLLG